MKQNSQSYECSIEAAKLIYDMNPSANQKRALELLNDTNNKLNSSNLKVKMFVFIIDNRIDFPR